MAGKSPSRQKNGLGGDQAAWYEPPEIKSGGSYKSAYFSAYFSAWLAGNVNSEQKIFSNCCPFK
jgi:hypothetical protein